MSILTLHEHETFAIGDAFCADGKKSVTHAQADALDKLSKRLASAKGGLFTHANHTTLKARQYVGVVQLGAEARLSHDILELAGPTLTIRQEVYRFIVD